MKPDRERLKELKEDCEFAIKNGHFIPATDNNDIITLIDSALAEPSEIVEHGVVAKECIARYKADPQKAIEQIEWCGYECEGGILEKNLAWDEIKELLAEPSADVAEAIAMLEDMGKHEQWCIDTINAGKMETDDTGHYTTPESAERMLATRQANHKRIDTILNALRQYQKPTDEAVQRVIADMEIVFRAYEKELQDETRLPYPRRSGNDIDMLHSIITSLKFAITALRQMGSTEPCEVWIDNEGIHTKPAPTKIRYSICSGWCEACGHEIDLDSHWKYCANCGRPLEGR